MGVAGGRSTGAVHEWNALLAESPRNPVFRCARALQAALASEQLCKRRRCPDRPPGSRARSRCDQREVFQWRIRNVPYPPEVFSVTADPAERKLVIRTANKKYFKRFPVPELDLLGLPLEQHRLQWHHANITLVVSYAKPPAVLAAENEERAQRHAMRGKEEGNVDCKQQ